MTDAETFLILNAAHLKKMVTAGEIADASGAGLDRAQQVLEAAVADGLAMEMDGKFLLLPEGTEAVQASYNELYASLRVDPAITAWYDRFEVINAQFIKQVSDWQAAEGDDRIQGRLIKTVERLMKNVGELLAAIPRYEQYLNRFAASIALADGGDKDYVCKPTIDSIHNIWFEFHEDILSVLGRPRDV
jgi:hypothetical protein